MITLEQIRAARAMIGLKQHELAEKAGLSTGTLNNIERGVQKDPKLSTLRAIQQALEAEGIAFTTQENGSIGIRYQPPKKQAGISKLLIIDDNAMDRKLYKAWLGQQSDKIYDIIEASNAKEGYEAFLEQSPACILLDFMMYGKDGFQLLIEMKKEHAQIPPIIFVTATHNHAVRKDVLAAGAYSYLDKKSLTKEKLCDIIAQAVTSASATF
jgi:CheY-like chemotaxis protein/DNA-binding Xre family transcriptional regulator